MAHSRHLRTPWRRAWLPLAIIGSAILSACSQWAADPVDTAASDFCSNIEEWIREAREDAFFGRYAETQTNLLKVVSTYNETDDGAGCPAAVSRSRVLVSLALAYSNQQKFLQAEGEFFRAEAAIQSGPQASAEQDRAFLAAAKTQHALNQGDVSGLINANMSVARDGESDFVAPVGEGFELEDEEVVSTLDQATRSLVVAYTHYLKDGSAIAAAEQNINEAIALVSQVEAQAPLYLPRFQILQAKIQLQRDDEAAARSALRTINAAIEGFRAGGLEDTSTIVAQAQFTKGRILIDLDEMDAAIDAYQAGIDIYTEYPSPVRLEALWPYFMTQLRRAEARPNDQETIYTEMFEAAQIIRGSITANEIAGATAALAGGDSANPAARNAIEAWRRTREEAAALKRARSRAEASEFGLYDPATAARVSEQIEALDAEIVQLRRRIDRVAPEYNASIDKPVSPADVRASLGDDALFVHSVIRETESGAVSTQDSSTTGLLFFVDQDSIDVRVLEGLAQTEALARNLRRSVKFVQGADGRLRMPVYRADFAHRLFNGLFGDVYGPRLAGRGEDAYSSLVFVPSGVFKQFPLEILVSDMPADKADRDSLVIQALQTNDYTGFDWLGERLTFSYAPSPRVFVNVSRATAAAGTSRSDDTSILAAGSFVPSGSVPGFSVDRWMQSSGLTQACRDRAEFVSLLPSLAGTFDEVTQIAALSRADGEAGRGTTVLLADNFTEASLRTDANLGDYRVIHFATHGVLWDSADCSVEPALATTVSFDDETDRTPGLLTTSEIRDLDLNADLVVLSACDTTSENASAGESLSGLARAFFLSNAKAVVATHWSVADRETRDLMTAFYASAQNEEMSVAASLRQAQTSVRSQPESSHPIFWGAFHVIGDGRLKL